MRTKFSKSFVTTFFPVGDDIRARSRTLTVEQKAALAELKERRPDRVLETNVEFWAAIVLDFAEVPANMFTSMFTCARTGGWSAHILEQKTTGRLIRPSAIYVGPGERPASDIEGWNDAWGDTDASEEPVA